MGAHQKIDRSAYKYLMKLTDDNEGFPPIKSVLHFEGKNGPDGIKRKSPAKDEPWHFYDPFDEDDTELLTQVRAHYGDLVRHLKKRNEEKASFDAAWLAHALVDGLTPAHHYPYEEEMSKIRGGEKEERDSILSKLFVPGETTSEIMKKNWALWGTGGLMSAHTLFEVGVAFIISPISIKTGMPTEKDIELMLDIGYEEVFKRAARQVSLLDMYERFIKEGWSRKMIREVRNELAPAIVKTVCLVWYSAMRDAGLLKGKN